MHIKITTMTLTEKELYNEKITGVHGLIQANADIQNEVNENILASLKRIEIQTTKTNGRVTKLEKTQLNCPNASKLDVRLSSLEKWKWTSVGYITGAGLIIGIIFKILN